MKLDGLVDDFAERSFRDIADGDYIAARMACKAALVTQYLWASQQAVEKYLKCILLLNRIEAHNAPLYLNPQILDEVLKYVHIPKELAAGYRTHVRS